VYLPIVQLTKEDQATFRTGAFRMLPDRDRSGRGVFVARLADYNITNNVKSIARRGWYVYSAVEDDPQIQRRGIVTVPYFGGNWKSSPLEVLRVASLYPFDAQPFHEVSTHCVYSDSTRRDLIQTIRKFFPKDVRMRFRLHFGSPLETEYVLRTFGLDVSRELFRESDDEELSRSIEEDIRKRQQLDDDWCLSEAPY